MKKQLTILVVSFNTVGPMNACIGAVKGFLARGHKVIFMVEPNFQGQLKNKGFDEYVVKYSFDPDAPKEFAPGESAARHMHETGLIGRGSPLEKIKIFVDQYVENEWADGFIKNLNRDVEEAIKELNPGLIVLDQLAIVPAIYYSNIPWIQMMSTPPCARPYFADDLPPGGSGYPSDRSTHQDVWDVHKQVHRRIFYSSRFSDLLEEMGYDRYPDNARLPQTQLLTVYAYPDELNYPQMLAKDKTKFFNLQVFSKIDPNSSTSLEHLLPKEFVNDTLDGKFSGKYILFSLGSMASIDTTLMKRLVAILAKTNHKYIVSKGHSHLEWDLAKNMWGQRFLAQAKFMPLVDLVITHGGNNTVTETFALGKPMLVLPIFWDQFDNAQRLHETGYGIRVDAYECTDNELIGSIDKLLEDKALHAKLKAASQRIQASNVPEEFCDAVESLLC